MIDILVEDEAEATVVAKILVVFPGSKSWTENDRENFVICRSRESQGRYIA